MMAEVAKADTCQQKLDGSAGMARVRKRPLEDGEYDEETQIKQDRQPNSADEVDRSSSLPLKHATGSAAVLDEIEQHFQRSLSQATRWKPAAEDDKKAFASSVPPLIQATEEDSLEDVDTPKNGTACSSHLPPSSVIPLYVCSGTDVSAKNTVSPISRDNDEMKLISSQSPSDSPGDELSSPLGRSHVHLSVVSSSIPTVTSLSSPSSHMPFFQTSSERLSSKVPDHTSTKQTTTTNIQSHISPILPGNHVQVIDLTKNWTKSLAASPRGSTVFTTPAAASHPLRVPTVPNLATSSGIPAKGTIAVSNNDVPVPSNSGSPIMLLPTSVVQPQPYVLVNPSDLQQVNIAPLINSSGFYPATTKLVPEVLTAGAGNGYILVSPNPMVQVVSKAGTSIVPTTVSTPTLLPSTQPVTYMNISTKTINPFKAASQSLSKDKGDDIDVMPATVEDHFAKALGDQWSKLNSNNTVSPSQSTVIS